MNKYIYYLLVIGLCVQGCGSAFPSYNPLEEKLLKLVDVVPSQGDDVGLDGNILLMFSKEVNPQTITDRSITILKSEELPDDISKIKVSELNSISGEFAVMESGVDVLCYPAGGFAEAGEYSIIITNELSSIDGYPFTSGSLGKPYVSTFHVIGEYLSGDVPSESGDVPVDQADGGTSSEGGSSKPPSTPAATPPPASPSYVFINEIFYDVAGTDTNGDVFVELIGEPGGCVEGYYLAFVNGADGKTYKTISIPKDKFIAEDGLFVIADTDSSGKTNVADADLLENFDPQNGPDSIQLISKDGKLIDVLGYGAVTLSKAQNGLDMFEGAPAEDVSEGRSLSRVAGEADTGDNSVDFVVNLSPSSGSLDVQ